MLVVTKMDLLSPHMSTGYPAEPLILRGVVNHAVIEAVDLPNFKIWYRELVSVMKLFVECIYGIWLCINRVPGGVWCTAGVVPHVNEL